MEANLIPRMFKKKIAQWGVILSSIVFTTIAMAHVGNVEAVCTSYGYNGCSTPFKDVKNHVYRDAIEYVQNQGIVKGYSDGTYKPDSPINRAEFSKILIETILGQAPTKVSPSCFPDVEESMWYEPYVCEAKKKKIINGYPDGTFGGANNVNVAEAAKIIVNSFSIPFSETNTTSYWFTPYIIALNDQHNLPTSIAQANQALTRGEMAEMIMRIKTSTKNKPSLTACDLIQEVCPENSFSGYGDENLKNVDMAKVRVSWLAWYNSERMKAGLQPYTYNNTLNKTAYIWSTYSKDIGSMSHKRPGQEAYYDYNIIKEWFRNLGVEFENVSTVTFTENIGWGPYSCSSADCTQNLIDNVRSTFDFYMAEKDKADRPHYNSVMNKYFKEIGLGIVVDTAQKKYYLTVHYGTKIL